VIVVISSMIMVVGCLLQVLLELPVGPGSTPCQIRQADNYVC
jgi:hypothetical protein